MKKFGPAGYSQLQKIVASSETTFDHIKNADEEFAQWLEHSPVKATKRELKKFNEVYDFYTSVLNKEYDRISTSNKEISDGYTRV